MDYSAFSIQALVQWVMELFAYHKGDVFMIGSIPFAILFIIFLSIYVLLKRYTRIGMMAYVVAFGLFFAYKVNDTLMWLLPVTAVINYALTQEMRLREGRSRKGLLTAVILIDIAVLGYFKYTNFLLGDVLNAMLGTNFSLRAIALPVGISFYTFQTISYAVDTYKRKFTQDVTLLEYCFYLTFFPLLLAGPITRAQFLIPRLKCNCMPSGRQLWLGLFLVMLGLVKKNMVSDYLAQFNNWVFDAPNTFSGFENMAAILGYPVQIFLDFSGYSDMSIGVAAILGFYLPDNFNFPYRSLSVTEFWRRWHISLSFWFRDYLYIPLGGNRCGTLRTYLNNFTTMLVAGLWHGSSWMFVIWGALHGLGLVVHKFFSRQLGWKIPSCCVGNFVSWLLTYIYVSFAWSFFRAADLSHLGQMYNRVVTDFSFDYLLPFSMARPMWVVMLVGVMLSYLFTERQYKRMQLRFITLPWAVKLLIFIVCLQLCVQLASENVQPFIYTQF